MLRAFPQHPYPSAASHTLPHRHPHPYPLCCAPQVLSVTYGEVPSDNGGVDKGSGFSLLISKNLRANDIGVVVTGAPYTNRNDGLVTNNGIVSSLKVPMKVDEVSGTHHTSNFSKLARCASRFPAVNVQLNDPIFRLLLFVYAQVDYVNSCPSSCVGKIIPAGAKMIASRMILRKYGIAGLVEVSSCHRHSSSKDARAQARFCHRPRCCCSYYRRVLMALSGCTCNAECE